MIYFRAVSNFSAQMGLFKNFEGNFSSMGPPPAEKKNVDPLPWAEGACPPMNTGLTLRLSLTDDFGSADNLYSTLRDQSFFK